MTYSPFSCLLAASMILDILSSVYQPESVMTCAFPLLSAAVDVLTASVAAALEDPAADVLVAWLAFAPHPANIDIIMVPVNVTLTNFRFIRCTSFFMVL